VGRACLPGGDKSPRRRSDHKGDRGRCPPGRRPLPVFGTGYFADFRPDSDADFPLGSESEGLAPSALQMDWMARCARTLLPAASSAAASSCVAGTHRFRPSEPPAIIPPAGGLPPSTAVDRALARAELRMEYGLPLWRCVTRLPGRLGA
jgi:hypothetical protein